MDSVYSTGFSSLYTSAAGAWKAVSEAGPAVANAARLASQIAANPAMLPVILPAIAWEQIPEMLKGPIIDEILRACLTAARTVEIPNVTGIPVATIMKHVVIGALERALSYPTGMKVRVADRMAQIVLNPSPDFSLGFLKGLITGLWDGLTGPFVLLWDLAKIGYEIQSAQMRLISTLVHKESRDKLGKDLRAALDKIERRIAKVVADLAASKGDPRAILSLIDQLVNAALRGVESLGASLADALLKFMNRPDEGLGEGVGWVAGTATFEVLLLVLTEGGYTAIKNAAQGLRVVVRLVEAGTTAWEALGPVRAALTTFRNFASANRALGPLVEALEEAFSLLVRFFRMSYGLEGGAGAAARAGEHGVGAGERSCPRDPRSRHRDGRDAYVHPSRRRQDHPLQRLLPRTCREHRPARARPSRRADARGECPAGQGGRTDLRRGTRSQGKRRSQRR
jgi:hypothetical protein